MIRGIHHIAIHCRDIDRMKQFYIDGLGFEEFNADFTWEKGTDMIDEVIGVSGSAARCMMLRAGNCYVEMFQFNSPEPEVGHPLRPYSNGYTHFCVDVTDIHAEFERLKTLGMTFWADAPVDAGHVLAAYGQDPEGNIIELQETRENCDFKMESLSPVAAE